MTSCNKNPDRIDVEQERIWFLRFKKDPEQYAHIVKEYSPAISGYLLRRVGDVHVAEELTQETFVQAFTGFVKFEWRGLPLGGFLFKIARNVYFAWYRKNKKNQEITFDPNSHEVEGWDQSDRTLEEQRVYDILMSCMAQLTDKQREIIDLHYWGGLKVREVAIVMGVNKATVQSLLQRGRVLLKKELQKQGLVFASFSLFSGTDLEPTLHEDIWDINEFSEREGLNNE